MYAPTQAREQKVDPVIALLTSIEGCVAFSQEPPRGTLSEQLRERQYVCRYGSVSCTVQRMPAASNFYYEVHVGDDVFYPTSDEGLKGLIKDLLQVP